jgi:hypothetical protein
LVNFIIIKIILYNYKKLYKNELDEIYLSTARAAGTLARPSLIITSYCLFRLAGNST